MSALDFCGMTDPGLVRQNNEDAWLVNPQLRLAIVADGMGGAACGEIASALTIKTVAAYLRQPPEDLSPEALLKEAVREANRRVLECARQKPDCDGMGSTIVLALWKLPRLLVANVGDSRAYLSRAGALKQISHDQTLANELRLTLGLTEEQIDSYPHKNVLTVAIGAAEDILVMMQEERLEPGDEVLLCSDGLYGPIGDRQIAEALREKDLLESKVRKLLERATAAGAPDNITAVLLRYPE